VSYYYHFDGLGSVVALSNSSGTTIQTYEYTVYGEVAAEDPNHPNPYLFTGRRFDRETGLYYYRARYYNPYIGRFLQTDPVGYFAGINWYRYCRNNPVGYVDPSGLDLVDPTQPLTIGLYGDDPNYAEAANDFDLAIPMVPPPGSNMTSTEWILYILDFLVRAGYQISDIYVFDDSTSVPISTDVGPAMAVQQLQFGNAVFDVKVEVSIDPEGRVQRSLAGDLGTFFAALGGIWLNRPDGIQPQLIPNIHLRHDWAAEGYSSASADLLLIYSSSTGLIMTAVNGELEYYGEEVPGPDYRFINPGNYGTGCVYITYAFYRTYGLEWFCRFWSCDPIY